MSTSTITFSVSERYKTDIEKIINALPKMEKSRFICQSMVEKYNNVYGGQQSNLLSDNFGLGDKKIEPKKDVVEIASKEVIQTPLIPQTTDDMNLFKDVANYILLKNKDNIQNVGFLMVKVASGNSQAIEDLLSKYPEDVMAYAGGSISPLNSTPVLTSNESIQKKIISESSIHVEKPEKIVESEQKTTNKLKNRTNGW